MIHPGKGIPQTRNQAFSLLKAVDFDEGRLTQDQVKAIRDLYGLPVGGEEAPGS